MKKTVMKIASLCVVLSMLLTLFTVFPQAESNSTGEDEGTKVFYNRGYSDGWDYENGFDTAFKHELDVNLTYKKNSASWYEYYMKLSPSGDRGGFMGVNLGEGAREAGKLFIELDFAASAENNIGDMLLVKNASDGSLYHILGVEEGGLYLLGQRVCDAPTYFTTISFVFDFDYAANNVEAKDNEFLVTVEMGTGLKHSRVYTASEGFGISDVYIGAQENFLGGDRAGDYYFVDNFKIYQADAKEELDSLDFGSAIDTTLPRTFSVLGAGSVGGYLSGAPTLERVPATADQKIYYNRYFSEGWDFDVGINNTANLRDNEFSIATDYAADLAMGDAGFLNYYLQVVQRNTQNGFIAFEVLGLSPRNEGKAYFEFDFKCSAGANIPGILTFLTLGSPILYSTTMEVKDGTLMVLGTSVGQVAEEWVHIVFEMDYEYGPSVGDPTAILYTAYIGEENIKVSTVVHIDGSETAYRGIRQIRIGRGGTLFRDGDWFGMDNVRFYSGTAPLEEDFESAGLLINPETSKTISITSSDSSQTVGDAVETSLTMKVNSDKALLFGKKINLFEDSEGVAFGGPYKLDGKVMVPLDSILRYTKVPYRYNSDGLGCDIFVGGSYRSIAIGRDTVMLGEENYRLAHSPVIKSFGDTQLLYICLDDVEKLFDGFFVTYDEVGFISIATVDDYVVRDNDEDYMREIMKRFIFDDLAAEDVYELAKKNTNNFEHPYFYVNQDRFDYLNDVYNSEPGDEIYDEDLAYYIEYSLDYALEYYNKYALLDENGKYIGIKEGQWVPNSEGIVSWVTTLPTGNHSVSIMPYAETGGYDPAGGRLNVISDGETGLSMACQILAHAYQITRNEDYARFVYDWAVALCQWQHWAPGHYLNCAQPCLNIGLSYDWLYNTWIDLGLDPAPIRDGLYKHGVITSWRSLNRLSCEFYRKQGDASNYWNHVGNWNSVSASGVFAACMVALEDPAYVEKASFSFAKTLYYLQTNGFDLFGLDGSYRETAGYWCATIRFIQYDAMLVEAITGSYMGLLDAPGLDITNYFGSHMESSDYSRWNYGDDWEGSQENYWFYLSAELFDNPEFAVLRYIHMKNGKEPYRWDTLWYDPEVAKGDTELSLDFVLNSTEAMLSRSSWEPGALYVGIMGDKNHVAHGQYDSGNWIYDNGGVRWFVDLGADNYNLYGGGFASGYYCYSPEGQNTMAIASQPDTMPHGQMYEYGGLLTKSISNKYGSVAILDQAPTFGGASVVTYARRGMLLTNDRKTVVIQDEMNMVIAQDLYWFAHYDTNIVKTTLSENGKTAYMEAESPITGETLTLRVSLLTPNRGFKFEIWDTYTFALDATPRPDYSPTMNGLYEQNRNKYNKLVIKAEGVLKFEAAIVLELIDPDNPIDVGYKQGWQGNPAALQPMSSWVPTEDTRLLEDKPEEIEIPTRRATLSSIILAGNMINGYMDVGDYFDAYRSDFFRALTDVEYAISVFGRDHTAEEIISSLELYDKARVKYDKFWGKASKDNTSANDIAKNLITIKEADNSDAE